MLLAIDIGNTHIVFGIYRQSELLFSWRIRSDSNQTVDEYALVLLGLLRQVELLPKQIDSIIIGCVVPELTRVFSKLAQKYFDLTPMVVGRGIDCGVNIAVENPESVGADRIVNAVAAKSLYGAPTIVVDFGTATTFDVVGSDGSYQGGVIAPGLIISAHALFEKTAQLPQIELKQPEVVIGKNTHDSMLSGIVFGYVSLVDGVICKISSELGQKPKVVATGGLARLIASSSNEIQHLNPELTLHGLYLIAEQQKKGSHR